MMKQGDHAFMPWNYWKFAECVKAGISYDHGNFLRWATENYEFGKVISLGYFIWSRENREVASGFMCAIQMIAARRRW